MKHLIVIALILILSGCATTRTPEEVEWRNSIDRENWAMCAAAYRKAGGKSYLIHNNHTHRSGHTTPIADVRLDLTANNCRMVLGQAWAHY